MEDSLHPCSIRFVRSKYKCDAIGASLSRNDGGARSTRARIPTVCCLSRFHRDSFLPTRAKPCDYIMF